VLLTSIEKKLIFVLIFVFLCIQAQFNRSLQLQVLPAQEQARVIDSPHITTTADSTSMLLSGEVQLGYALEAFNYAHSKGAGWSTKYLIYLTKAGISSMPELLTGCKEDTINLDLDFLGIPPEDRLKDETIDLLASFLPGPVGFRCFRLAQKAGQKVKSGTADAKYVHRPESGKKGDEQWDLKGDDWTLHVDCAGFVRSVLKHVTKDAFVVSLSDRSFMRAKDFYRFFETIPYTVTEKGEMPESDKRMQWRLVRDLRMVIPGDIIVYRPKGNAAGGAAFTKNDRSDVKHVLKAVKTAKIWKDEEGEWKNLVKRNVARDPIIKPWVEDNRQKLANIGVTTVTHLREQIDSVNTLLEGKGETPFPAEMLQLIRECCETTALNTGHIVFAAGPAVHMGGDEYRIRVVHSTKYGVKDDQGVATEGVQEYFKRFHLLERPDGTKHWSREMKKEAVVDESTSGFETDDDDPDFDDPEDEDKLPLVEPEDAAEDDVAGLADVEVLAARMCF
jgi:hypothetical protein